LSGDRWSRKQEVYEVLEVSKTPEHPCIVFKCECCGRPAKCRIDKIPLNNLTTYIDLCEECAIKLAEDIRKVIEETIEKKPRLIMLPIFDSEDRYGTIRDILEGKITFSKPAKQEESEDAGKQETELKISHEEVVGALAGTDTLDYSELLKNTLDSKDVTVKETRTLIIDLDKIDEIHIVVDGKTAVFKRER